MNTRRLIAVMGACFAISACGPTHRLGSTLAAQAVPKVSLPDPSQTPGTLCTADSPNFEGYRYDEHVPYCKRHVTKKMKEQIGAAYGIDESDWSNYEFDHYLPLGIGGSSDIANIWPQPKAEALVKDKLEDELYNQMADGTTKQADAVAQIRAWR